LLRFWAMPSTARCSDGGALLVQLGAAVRSERVRLLPVMSLHHSMRCARREQPCAAAARARRSGIVPARPSAASADGGRARARSCSTARTSWASWASWCSGLRTTSACGRTRCQARTRACNVRHVCQHACLRTRAAQPRLHRPPAQSTACAAIASSAPAGPACADAPRRLPSRAAERMQEGAHAVTAWRAAKKRVQV